MSINVNTFGEHLFGDLLGVNILSVTEDRYMPAINGFVQRENEFLDLISSILCDSGIEVQTGCLNGVGGKMHKITKRGGAEATKAGARWFTAYPIFAFGNKQLYEIPWLQRAKFIDLAPTILNAVLQDVQTTISEMLGALLSSTNFNFDDSQWPGMNAQNLGEAAGPVVVRRLANADGSTGSVYAHGEEIPLADLNHYLVSGSDTITVGAFGLARDALRNVGNDADIVYVVSRATADYVEDHFSVTDYTKPVELLQTQLSQDVMGIYARASQFSLLGPGVRTRGRVKKGELVEWPHFPDGYIFAYDRTKEAPLRRRISDLPQEQGLHLATEDDSPDIQGNPLARKQWRRIQGFGARNRVNGVVVQITDDEDYTDPTL